MAKVFDNIPLIEQFVVDKSQSTNLAKKWDTWLEDFKLFMTASGVTNVEQKSFATSHGW